MSTKTAIKKTITVKTKPNTKVPSKPRLAKRAVRQVPNTEDTDIEIEFDDELQNPINVNNDLDDFLLASRNETIATASDEERQTHIKKEMVGSKAKLLALMVNRPTGSIHEDQSDVESESIPEDPEEHEEIPSDVDYDGNNSDSDLNKDEQTNTQLKKSKKTITKSKKTTTKGPTVKRGPGRPPKTQKKDPIPRKGVSRSPHDSNNFVEFLYDQPVVMKKIFSFFKSVAASEIQILFRPRDIIFYAIDHNGKTRIRIRVDAEKLNHYYCRDVLDVGISQKEMEMILNKVDKDYSSMVILSDNTTTRRNLTIVFENDIRIDELHRIDLIASYNKMEDESAFIDEEYMIKFNFPGKYFKKTVSDIKSMSSQLSITQEDNDSPLIFEYLTENKRIQSKHTVKDSSKIKLVSNLDDGESFRVDVCIDYLKPISSSQIADDINILVDENKAFMTKSYIDGGTIEIKTLTEIIDERPESDED